MKYQKMKWLYNSLHIAEKKDSESKERYKASIQDTAQWVEYIKREGNLCLRIQQAYFQKTRRLGINEQKKPT